METAKSFDPYEVIGIICPGVVLALLVATEAPQFQALLASESFSLGNLGLFLIVAFILGHLVQSAGNILEFAVWPISGLPTNRLRYSKQTLITAGQHNALTAAVRAMEGSDASLENYNRPAWRAIIARAYSRVRAAGRSERIDTANRSYGLFRGLVAAFAITLLWYLIRHPDQRELLLLVAVMLLAAIVRMRRKGIQYARALVQEFIDLPASNPTA